MKQELEKIYNRKKRTIKQLFKSNNELLAVVYKGLAQNKPIRVIHKEIKQVFIKLPIKDVKTYKYCLKVAKQGKKYVERQTHNALIGLGVASLGVKQEYYNNFAWEFISGKHVYEETKQISYQYAQNEETKAKDNVIKIALRSENVFFLASSHSDCANDHLKYQGKIYYNANWRKHIGSYTMIDEIERYIKANHLKTLQWVVGKPVWFITRPNCRHYFKKLSVEEVLDARSVKSLLDKYEMDKQIGKRNAQTLRHPMRKEWYKEENIESLIEKYNDRLEFHKRMYEVAPNDELKNWIEKDKFLIKKWQDYGRKLNR